MRDCPERRRQPGQEQRAMIVTREGANDEEDWGNEDWSS